MASLPSTKRIGSLDLRALLQGQAAREIKMGQPRELTCWTRTSITHGMQLHHADRTGLHPFARLPAPGEASLADGFPDEFIKKPSNEPCGVENVIKAAQQVVHNVFVVPTNSTHQGALLRQKYHWRSMTL